MKKHLKALYGFPVGIAMLALSYVIVYLIDGEETYLHELLKLTDIKFMAAQAIISGIAYILLFEAVILFNAFSKRYSKKITWGALFKFILGVAIFGVAPQIIDFVFKTRDVMSGQVGSVLVGTEFIILLVGAIIYCIVHTIEEIKINKALKERNSKKEE